MQMKSNTPFYIAVVCALLLAAWVGYSFHETKDVRHENIVARDAPVVVVREAVPSADYPRGYTGDTGKGGRAGTPPDEIIVTPIAGAVGPPGADGAPGEVRTVILVDTLRIAVPEALASDPGNVRLTTQNPVDVKRPLFGTPTVSVSTYNPNTSQYEVLRYRVPEHPFQYGAEVEVYGAAPLANARELGAARIGAAARVYVGYRGLQPFTGLHVTTEGVEVRAGLRYRIGR